MLWDKHPWAARSPPGEDSTLPEEKDQPRLKFANPGGGRGHIHGLLPTTKHDLQRREAKTLQCCLHHMHSSSQERREPSLGDTSY